jgi:hypothetical protein
LFQRAKPLRALLLIGIAATFGLPTMAADGPPPMPRPRPAMLDQPDQPDPSPATPDQDTAQPDANDPDAAESDQGNDGAEVDEPSPLDESPAEIAKLGPRPRPVKLVADVTEKGAQIAGGLVWRIFDALPDQKGNLTLVAKSSDAAPTLDLKPGNYLVHVAYGEAQASDTLAVRGKPLEKTMILDVGGLRLNAAIAGDIAIPPNLLHFDIFMAGATASERTLVVGKINPGTIVALNAGIYHVVSHFGDLNATETADLRVQPGQVTDATLYQKAAQVSFKLVTQVGGEAIADVDWMVKARDGKQLFAESGSYPTLALEAGDYTVEAKRAGKTYTKDFTVAAGNPVEIALLTGGS